MGRIRRRGRRGDATAVFTYKAVSGVPSVTVSRIGRGHPLGEAAEPHAHDFPAVIYFERGGGFRSSGGRRWEIEAGDVFVVVPGEVQDTDELGNAEGWVVLFPAEVLGGQAPGALLSWRAHPLLLPFVRGTAGGAQRLRVPPGKRPSWSVRLSDLERELRERRDGYGEAALAHLTLLLVEVARLASDVVEDLRLNDEPLLVRIFGFIEDRYPEPISLKDVARALGLTPGHLTTVVRRKTGRTVVGWISERRMSEARKLLVETDLSIGEVGRRSGYKDPTYFVRSFKRAHGVTPLEWRRAGRPQGRQSG